MKLFFLIEGLYKLLGLVITMLQARILGPGRLGEFQFYQSNVFGYLNSATLLATDYKNLVAYQADPAYGQSAEFYTGMAAKTAMLALATLALLALWPRLTEFALLPYALALGFNLLQFDYLIYGHRIQAPFAVVRLLSQVFSLVALGGFWLGWFDIRWFTVYQLIQTATLNLGILVLVRRHLHFDFSAYFSALRRLKPAAFADLGRYFITNQFITYVTTIEAVLLAWQGLDSAKHVFTEGQRLAQVLTPWVVFYLSYNIGKDKAGFRGRILQLVAFLMLASPLTTALLYGRDYLDRIYFYNFFLLMFLMVALLQDKNLKVLAADRGQSAALARLNLGFFLGSTLLMAGVLSLGLPLPWLLAIFLAKLWLYHGIFNWRFRVAEPAWFLPASLIGLAALNAALAQSGYYLVVSARWLAVQDGALALIKNGIAP
ncbi:MAG: hypothetical protein HYV16_09160 [Gammaproteobacteria bacterium]|nr:hypothetical protein [Gammaproteobacteria bacterium]